MSIVLDQTQKIVVVRETIVSMAINAVMTGLATWLLFRGSEIVPYVSSAGPAIRDDLVITGFIVGLMSTLPATLMVRKALAKQAVGPLLPPRPRFLPAGLVKRLAVVAGTSALILFVLQAVLVPVLDIDGVFFAVYLPFKMVLAFVLAGFLTPVVVLRALGDDRQ